MDLLHFVIYHQPWTRGRKPLFLIIRTILKWPAFMRVPLHGGMFSVPWGIHSRRMVVTFNILQDLPDGALKQMHDSTVPPATKERATVLFTNFPRPSLFIVWSPGALFCFFMTATLLGMAPYLMRF